MSVQESEKKRSRRSLTERYRNLIEVLKYVAKERRYSILDRLARSISRDMALQSIYEAIRLARTSGEVRVPENELAEEVMEFQQDLKRGTAIAKELATIAIVYASKEYEESSTQRQTQS